MQPIVVMNKERELNFVFRCFGLIKQKKSQRVIDEAVGLQQQKIRERDKQFSFELVKDVPQSSHVKYAIWSLTWNSRVRSALKKQVRNFYIFCNTGRYYAVDCHLYTEEWVKGRLEGQSSRACHYYIRWWKRTRKNAPTVVFEQTTVQKSR